MKQINHIVLIDDSKIDCLVNKKIITLNYQNIDTTTFNSAQSALHYFQALFTNENLSLKEHIDLVLLDVNMPSMSGFEFLGRLQELKGYDEDLFEIFFLSSSVNSQDINRAKQFEWCSGYITKPLDKFKLQKVFSPNEARNLLIS